MAWTEEQRRLQSERQKARWRNPDYRSSQSEALSRGQTGVKHSEERNRCQSERLRGKKFTGGDASGFYFTEEGYKILTGQWGHPLCLDNGEVKEHRKVLYEKIGSGTHHCHWCGREINWTGPHNQIICADHLDRNRLNNDPENLVPSCFQCNWDRDNPRGPSKLWGHQGC